MAGRRDLRQMILDRFEEAGIEVTLVQTFYYMHAFNIANTMDLDGYDVIIACGGDGTVNETFNGVLHRTDKKKIPLGLIPNGSGNDFAATFNIRDAKRALDFIIKGDLLKFDVCRA